MQRGQFFKSLAALIAAPALISEANGKCLMPPQSNKPIDNVIPGNGPIKVYGLSDIRVGDQLRTSNGQFVFVTASNNEYIEVRSVDGRSLNIDNKTEFCKLGRAFNERLIKQQ